MQAVLRPAVRSALPALRQSRSSLIAPTPIRIAASTFHSASRLQSYGHSSGVKVLEQAPEICTDMQNAKAEKGLTFEQIAEKMGRTDVWVAALMFGQAKPEPNDLDKIAEILEIDRAYLEETFGPHFYPGRGLTPMPPTDALIYRLYEIVAIFGWPLKAVMHEKAGGDGIMSAIDCKFNVDKVNEDGADRIKITINGKWLPYRRF